jgi:hypothetical protein
MILYSVGPIDCAQCMQGFAPFVRTSVDFTVSHLLVFACAILLQMASVQLQSRKSRLGA